MADNREEVECKPVYLGKLTSLTETVPTEQAYTLSQAVITMARNTSGVMNYISPCGCDLQVITRKPAY